MVVCGLNECKASARPLSFVVVEQIWRRDPIRLAGIVRTAPRNNVSAWQLAKSWPLASMPSPRSRFGTRLAHNSGYCILPRLDHKAVWRIHPLPGDPLGCKEHAASWRIHPISSSILRAQGSPQQLGSGRLRRFSVHLV